MSAPCPCSRGQAGFLSELLLSPHRALLKGRGRTVVLGYHKPCKPNNALGSHQTVDSHEALLPLLKGEADQIHTIKQLNAGAALTISRHFKLEGY